MSGMFDLIGASRKAGLRWLGGLGAIPLLAAPTRLGSATAYIKRQPVVRYSINRAAFSSAAGARRLLIERRLMLAAAPRRFGVRGLGGLSGLSGAREDIEAALAAERQAQADALAVAGSLSQLELDDLATQAAYKAWGETEGRLGLPLSLGSFNLNAAYQRIRSQTSDVLPANLGNWLARVANPTAFAGEFLSNSEFAVSNLIGGNLDQVLATGRSIRAGLDRVGGTVIDLAGSFSESVEAGGLSIVQDAMRLRPSWLDSRLVGQVGDTLTRAIAAGSSNELGVLFMEIGAGVMAVGAVTGPAAPYVVAAGGLMMLGGFLADVFATSDSPPPPRPARIASEHWGTFKLLYAASVEASAGSSIQQVATEEMVKVFGDPNTGETMARPMPGWSAPGVRGSAEWPHAMRMVDMFNRRSLVENDRVAEWVRTGRGIAFDGVENSPNNLYAKVLDSDPFVKFAGAMASSPAPYATGGPPGDGTWPVGPINRWDDGYWTTSTYRAAFVAAAALGGCPPFASYGFWTDNLLAANYWASGRAFHCTGVGGRIEPGTGGRSSTRWIPWCSHYLARENVLRLIPPRRVPYHLQGLSNSSDEFRLWLFRGLITAAHVNYLFDPELAGGVVTGSAPGAPTIIGGDPAEAARLGMAGNPLDRAMTLEQFFAAPSGDIGWYERPFDENEPRTWFIKGTPAPLSGLRILPRTPMVASLKQQQQEAAAKKWSTTKKVAVGTTVVAVPVGVYFLGQALRWWK